ncbi:phage tail length tape measure family protein [Diaphorobacter caeni]|uniref:phage tail length tape measure family protein n=1 Tax=Diaphorobacter caeni TaxID=2784387 RepID=UPI00188E300B|nr:phage tail length tape measure family protein [Diaphorobacter caeni]MBF5006012.1 phage tail length tape measure family protein [Diaphorobacter caeni]
MSEALTTQLTATFDGTEASQGLAKLGTDAEKVSRKVKDAGDSANGGLKRIKDGAGVAADGMDALERRTAKSMQGFTNKLAAAGDAVKEWEGKLALKGLDSAKFKPYLDEMQQVIERNKSAAMGMDNIGISAKQTAAALRGVPAQFTDIIVSLQGGMNPMTVFLQQGGQLKDMFGGAGAAAKALGGYIAGLVNPYTIVAAAIAGVGVAYNQGSREQDTFVRAIVLSGNASGVSAGQLREYAREIDGIVGTQAQAAEGLAAFAAAGVRGGSQLRQFTETAIEWEKATGQAVSKTAEQFASLQDDPLKAVLKLNEGSNFLTASVYEQIKALTDQGRSADASRVAMDALDSSMRDRAKSIKDSLGYLERGWKAITGAAKDAWDAMLNVGRAATINDKLGEVRSELSRLLSQQGWGETGGGAATGRYSSAERKRIEERIAALRAEEWQLEANAAAEQMNAAAQAESNRIAQATIKWRQEGERYLSKHAQMERELAKARVEAADAGVTGAALEDRLAAIREKYAEKTRGAAASTRESNQEFERQRSLMAQLAGLSSDFYKQWDMLTKKFRDGGLSVKELEEQQQKLLAKQPAMVSAAKAEADALNEKIKSYQAEQQAQDAILTARQKAAETMAKSVQDMQNEIQAMRMASDENISMAKAVAKVALARAQENRDKAVAKGIDADNLKALDDEITKRKELIELIGNRDAFVQAQQAQKDMVAEFERSVQQVEDVFVRGFADMMNNGKSGWDSFCKSLKTSFYTLVAKEIYAAFAKPFVVQLVGSFLGTTGSSGGIMSMLSSLLGGGSDGTSSSSSGMGGWSNLLSIGKAIYNAITGGFSTLGSSFKGGIGNVVSGFGNMVGSPYLSGWGTGLAGGGLNAVPGALTEGAVAGHTAGSSAGSMSMGAMWPLAAIAGMFISSKLFKAGYSVDTWSTAQKATDPGNWFQTNMLAPLLGDKTANILTGAPLAKYIFDGLFGRKLKDAGVEGSVGGESGFEGRQFQYYKGGLFRSNKTKYSELDEETRSAFADQFFVVKDAVADMATSIGLSADSLVGFSSKIKVSMMGLTNAEINTKVAEEFKRIADEMAAVVLVSDEYTQGEETRAETLARLSTRMTAVNQWLDVMGDTLLEVSLVGADTASKLIDAFGGEEGFSTATGNYVSKYFSQSEQLDLVNKQIGDSLKTLGVDTVPKTREELKALINAQDLTTEAGRKAYAALLGVADVLDTVFSAAEAAKALGKDMDIQLLRATGKEDQAVALEREMRIKELEAYGDDVAKSLVDKQKQIWAAQDEAAAKEAAEAVKQTALAAAGLSVDSMVSGFIAEVNAGRGAEAGTWLADSIAVGFEQAIYNQAVGIIMNSIIDGVITPVVTAAMTGSSVSAAVSQAAIENMVANASAAAQALGAILNDPTFRAAIETVLGTVRDLGNSIGANMKPMSTYKASVSNVGSTYNYAANAADSAAEAAKKLADQWKSTVDSMTEEMKRLRGELLGGTDDQGMAYYESLYAIKTAQARAGDQDAADELPSIIQALEELAKGTAGTKAEVLLMQSAWLDSLTATRDLLANKYGVDIGNEQSSVTGATTAAAVIKGSAYTAVLGALQSSSDNPALLAVLQSIDARLERVEKDQRALGEPKVIALQSIDKNVNRLKMLKEMEGT